MIRIHTITAIITSLLLLGSCTASRDTDQISDEKIMELAKEEGNRITMETQQVLASSLKTAIEHDGIPQALKYCNVHAYPIVDSLEKKHGVEIKRASFYVRNPRDKPDKTESDILKDYEKTISSGNTPTPRVSITKETVHFARPIILSNQLCLNCHGKIGEDIKQEHYELIQALYPEDKATGHSMGDLRGIWSIKFNRNYFEKHLPE